MDLALTELKKISMKNDARFSERWLQGQLRKSPALLGLGELEFLEKERKQSSGGRLDLLFSDESGDTRYETEIQLGPVDETHIVRTLEYWDIERRRFPNIQHIAVIAAEEITARFHNVIGLFNQFIPIVALQVNAYQLPDDKVALIFTKVLDHRVLETLEDVIPSAADRPYWENKASVGTLRDIDTFLNVVNVQSKPTAYEPNYNKHYIGLVETSSGSVSTAIVFRPRKKHFRLEIKAVRDDELIDELEESLDFSGYDSGHGTYNLVVHGSKAQEDAQSEPLKALIRQSLQHLI